MVLTTQPLNAQLDLFPWVGQRSATFTFTHINGVTDEHLGQLHPVRTAQLSHDTARNIKRQLSLVLGVTDTAAINSITSRVEVAMVVGDITYPLGRYMITDMTRVISTGGTQASLLLTDEMFLVDQPISTGFSGIGSNVSTLLEQIVSDLPVDLIFEPSPYASAQSWTVGTSRGSILEDLSVSGDYMSPWFGNDGKLHFIRSFDPFKQIPQFDFDAGNQVIRDPITETDDLVTAPNRFIVVSNASNDMKVEISATFDVFPTAPHSIPNRGFVIPLVSFLPVLNETQANAIAENLAIRQTVFERVILSTPPDPRHDSYDVIRWQGQNWLELQWSMSLTEGAAMTHVLRKAYS